MAYKNIKSSSRMQDKDSMENGLQTKEAKEKKKKNRATLLLLLNNNCASFSYTQSILHIIGSTISTSPSESPHSSKYEQLFQFQRLI